RTDSSIGSRQCLSQWASSREAPPCAACTGLHWRRRKRWRRNATVSDQLQCPGECAGDWSQQGYLGLWSALEMPSHNIFRPRRSTRLSSSPTGSNVLYERRTSSYRSQDFHASYTCRDVTLQVTQDGRIVHVAPTFS
ncbi:unnamed protein product, partial [Mycena citricolor]